MDLRQDFADETHDSAVTFYLCHTWQGTPTGRDGQALYWYSLAEFKTEAQRFIGDANLMLQALEKYVGSSSAAA